MPEDSRKEFQSYLFFLRHFVCLITANRPNQSSEDLIRHLLAEQRPLLSGIQRRAANNGDLQVLRNLLFNSWNSEVTAHLYSAFEPDVKRFTNQWKPVQSYYATYFLLAPIHYLLGGTLPRRHEPTLAYATNSIAHWLPQPWSLRVDYDNKRLLGFPQGTAMWGPSGWNLRNNEPHFHVANFLRRTAQETQRDDWRAHFKGNKKRRIAGGPRKGRLYRVADVPVGLISFFNVLWRYRRWANCEEAQALTEGQDYPPHTDEFDAAFGTILENTAAVLENVICTRIGAPALDALYQEYLQLVRGKVDCSSIERRRSAVCPQNVAI